MRNRLLPVLLAISLFGCAGDLVDDLDVGSEDQPISGYAPNVGYAGLLVVTNGDGRVHTGILVAADIAVTGAAVTQGFSTSNLRVENGVGPGAPIGTTKTVSRVLYHPDLPIAYLKLSSAYSGRFPVLSTAAPSALVGTTPWCDGYANDVNRTLTRARMRVISGNDTSETYVVRSDFGDSIATDDDGIPCTDYGTGQVTGLALSTSGTDHTQVSARAIRAWLPVAQLLFPVAAQSGRFALYNGNNRCLDIAYGDMGDHAAVNEFNCHYASNQLWYFDYRQDSQHPAIVSARSGKCLDIPNSILTNTLQMYTCHGGNNQKVAQYLHNPQGSGLAYVTGATGGFAWPISSSLACLSVRPNSIATEFRSCRTGTTTNADQRWFITWR